MLKNTNDTIIYKTFSVHPNETREVLLPDSTEGDIRFNFIITHSGESQTTINVTSSYSAEVVIATGAYQNTRSLAPIRIGTYQRCYDLYLEYEVLPINNWGRHEVVVSFIIKRS